MVGTIEDVLAKAEKLAGVDGSLWKDEGEADESSAKKEEPEES